MKISNPTLIYTATFSLLLTALGNSNAEVSANQKVIHKALQAVFPRSVSADSLGYSSIKNFENIDPADRAAFEAHMQTLVNDSCTVITQWWTLIVDLISENSKNKIKHYVSKLAELEEKIHVLVAKNNTFLNNNNLHEAHRQILTIIQDFLIDLVYVANITRETMADKKQYLVKKGKPSSGLLCANLQSKLNNYSDKKNYYLDAIQYMWNLTVSAEYCDLIDPLQQTVEDMVQYYQQNPKVFSQEKIVAAIQHKLK